MVDNLKAQQKSPTQTEQPVGGVGGVGGSNDSKHAVSIQARA